MNSNAFDHTQLPCQACKCFPHLVYSSCRYVSIISKVCPRFDSHPISGCKVRAVSNEVAVVGTNTVGCDALANRNK